MYADAQPMTCHVLITKESSRGDYNERSCSSSRDGYGPVEENVEASALVRNRRRASSRWASVVSSVISTITSTRLPFRQGNPVRCNSPSVMIDASVLYDFTGSPP